MIVMDDKREDRQSCSVQCRVLCPVTGTLSYYESVGLDLGSAFLCVF